MSLTVETARDILLDAFDDIGVHINASTLKAEDERIGIKAINRIMAALSAEGVDLGFTVLTKINSVVTIPAGVMDALVALLGLRLWPKYRTPSVTQEIVGNARAGARLMYKIGVQVSATEFPGNLPRGSGNYNSLNLQDKFYSGDLVDNILAENNGSISLEDDTND